MQLAPKHPLWGPQELVCLRGGQSVMINLHFVQMGMPRSVSMLGTGPMRCPNSASLQPVEHWAHTAHTPGSGESVLMGAQEHRDLLVPQLQDPCCASGSLSASGTRTRSPAALSLALVLLQPSVLRTCTAWPWQHLWGPPLRGGGRALPGRREAAVHLDMLGRHCSRPPPADSAVCLLEPLPPTETAGKVPASLCRGFPCRLDRNRSFFLEQRLGWCRQ